MAMITVARLKMAALSVLCAVFVVVIVLFMIPDSPAYTYFLDFLNYIKQIDKVSGSITLAIMYAIAMLFCFPGTPFNLAAGYLFDIWLGSAVTIVGCAVGAIIAFLLGRTLGKDWAQEQVSKNKKFSLLSLAVENNAWLIIFLVRLSPVFPFGLCNYLFGVTKVKFNTYCTSTTLGLIPCTVAYTYLGSLINNLSEIFSEDAESDSNKTVLITVAIVVTIIGITVITFVTKRTLDKTMQQQQEKEKEREREMDKYPSTSFPIKEDEEDKPMLSEYSEDADTMV